MGFVVIEQYLKYANGMGASDEVISWINLVLPAYFRKHNGIAKYNFEHIIDFLVSSSAPKRLLKMSIKQAHESAEKWSKANQKKGSNIVDGPSDIKLIHEYKDGSCIVKLISQNAYKREGFLMSHCLGGYSVKNDIDIYSYRDKKNMPHATFEVRKRGGEITQIKGKGNGPIHPKYIMPILDFLESIGKKPRPSEMINLGYYYIDKAHYDFVMSLADAKKQIAVIHGEMYAHD